MSPTACRLPPAAARRRPPPACYREGVRPSFIDVQAGWDGLGGQLLASTRSWYAQRLGLGSVASREVLRKSEL